MSMLLVKMRKDYADEFDVEGFSVMTKEDFEKLKSGIKDHLANEGELTVSFGTNEELVFYVDSDVDREFSAIEIIDLEAERLKQLFGGLSFGTCTPAHVLSYVKE